jgi:GNAT superfamily N-acetyltransferase
MTVLDAARSAAERLGSRLDSRHILATLTLEGDGGSITAVHDAFDSTHLKLSIGRVVEAQATSSSQFRTLHAELATRLRVAGIDQVLRRVGLDSQAEIWALEATGYQLMDVGLIFEYRFTRPLPFPDPDGVVVRLSTDEDLSRIAPLMVQEPWASRYEADPAYRPDDVRDLRLQWLYNSHRGRADAMFVGTIDGQPAGYVTCRLDSQSRHGEVELVGTLPSFRGRGVALRIVGHALAWFSRQAVRATVRTQATNYGAVNLYTKAGFALARSDASFRLALTPPEGTAP